MASTSTTRAARPSSAGAVESSGIEVPEAGADFYEPKHVPHGGVRLRHYQSKVTGSVAASLRLHAAGLRCRHQDTLSSPLPAAWRRRECDQLDETGPRPPHPRQPDRRRKGEADDRGHGHRLCDKARRRPGAGCDRDAPDSKRVRRRRHQRSDSDDRRRVIARWPIATIAPWPDCPWVAARRSRSRRSISDSLPGLARSALRCATSTSRRP